MRTLSLVFKSIFIYRDKGKVILDNCIFLKMTSNLGEIYRYGNIVFESSCMNLQLATN